MPQDLPWKSRRSRKDESDEQLLEIRDHLLGNPSKAIERKKDAEICALYGGKSRQWLYLKKRELIKRGLIVQSDSGHIVIPEEHKAEAKFAALSLTDFAKLDVVARWLNYCKTANEGKPLSTTTNHLGYFYRVCMTLNVHPSAFTKSVEASETLLKQFQEKLRKGEGYYIRQHTKKQNRIDIHMKNFTDAVRHVMQYGAKMAIPRGISGVMSAKKKNFGAYSDIKFSDKDFLEGLHFTYQYGLHNLFGIIHETFVRSATGIALVNQFDIRKLTVIERTLDGSTKSYNCNYGRMEVFESKTQKKGAHLGRFTKYVFNPEVLKIINNVPRGQRFVEYTSARRIKNEINDVLRQWYASKGWIDFSKYDEMQDSWSYKVGTKEYYLANFTLYTLRHSGAHLWMRRTGFNATAVASMGWDDIATLTTAYARVDSDAFLVQDICYFHNPPIEPDEHYQHFCSMPHALAWYEKNASLQKVVAKHA